MCLCLSHACAYFTSGNWREISTSTSKMIHPPSWIFSDLLQRYCACVCLIFLCLFHMWEHCKLMLMLVLIAQVGTRLKSVTCPEMSISRDIFVAVAKCRSQFYFVQILKWWLKQKHWDKFISGHVTLCNILYATCVMQQHSEIIARQVATEGKWKLPSVTVPLRTIPPNTDWCKICAVYDNVGKADLGMDYWNPKRKLEDIIIKVVHLF